MVEGGIVRVRANYRAVYRCRIRRLEPGRALELEVRPAGLTVINVYEVEPTGAGSRIRHAFEVSGPISAVVRPFLAGIYRKQLEAEVDKLAREIRAENPPLDDQQALQKRNRKLGRINQAMLLIRGYFEQRNR